MAGIADRASDQAAALAARAPGRGLLVTGRRLTFSHLDKVYFPEAKLTKGDVLEYYRAISPYLLPHLHDRPLTLERFPEGIEAEHFYQKNAPSYFPEWLRTYPVSYRRSGKTDHHPIVEDEAGLLYLVNLGTLTFHTFLSRVSDLTHPDLLVIDIDPPEPPVFAEAVAAARLLREELASLGLEPLIKTSGKRGLHLALPLDGSLGYTEVRSSLVTLFDTLVARRPDLLTREIRKEKRGNRVYLDAFRMALGATLVPPYVVRATPVASVSMPIRWEELDELSSAKDFTIQNAPKRLEAVGDLWAELVQRGGSDAR